MIIKPHTIASTRLKTNEMITLKAERLLLISLNPIRDNIKLLPAITKQIINSNERVDSVAPMLLKEISVKKAQESKHRISAH